MSYTIAETLMGFLSDVFSVVYFTHPMQNREENLRRDYWAYLVLVGFLITVWPDDKWPYLEINVVAVRFFLRMMITMIFLILRKSGSFEKKIYWSLVLSIIYTNYTNIFMASPFIDFRKEKWIFFANPALNIIFIRLAMLLVLFVILFWIRRECDFEDTGRISRLRVVIYMLIAVVLIYMKQTMKMRYDIKNQFDVFSEIGVYYYALIILVFGTIVILERTSKLESRRNQLEEVIFMQNYRYQALLERERIEKRMDCFRHDIKNHLCVIRKMADENINVKNYVEQLQKNLDESRVIVDTGNSVINGLMVEKLRLAIEHSIHTHIDMDLHDTGFIRDVDLCTIITNAMDNAIEASMLVSESEKRRIHVKAGVKSGFLIFRFANYYEHEIQKTGDGLVTNKCEKEGHGLGIISIQFALEKYNGACYYDTDEKHYFVLKIMIPMQ